MYEKKQKCGCNQCCGYWNLAPFFNGADRKCPGICPGILDNFRPNMICLLVEMTITPEPSYAYIFDSLPNPMRITLHSDAKGYIGSGNRFEYFPSQPEKNDVGYPYFEWPAGGDVLSADYGISHGYFWKIDSSGAWPQFPQIHFGGTIPDHTADPSTYTCKADLKNLKFSASYYPPGSSWPTEYAGDNQLDATFPAAPKWELVSSSCSPFRLEYSGGKIYSKYTLFGTFTASISLMDCYNHKKYYWWCVGGQYKQGLTMPAGATSGPFQTLYDLVHSGCKFGTSATKSYYAVQDGTRYTPCNFSDSVPANPGSSKPQSGSVLGPFSTEGECIEFGGPFLWWTHAWSPTVQQSSLRIPNHYGPYVSRWDAHTQAHGGPSNDGSLEDTCKAPAAPAMCHACLPDGSVLLMTEAEARKNYYKIFWNQEQASLFCKAFTPPSMPAPAAKWWCVNYSPVSSIDPPNGTTGGPYDTRAECESDCFFGGTGNGVYWHYWYCVDGVARKYDNMPTGASSGPYATEAEAVAKCGQPDEPTPPIPVTRPAPPPPTPAEIKRVTIPCIHLGDNIEDPATCGCGTAVLRQCAVHGQCRKTGYPKNGEAICLTCPDYQSP